MQRPKLSDDAGGATVEFAVVTALFVAPLVSATQSVTAIQLRQVSLESMAQTLARDYSLRKDARLSIDLAKLLAEDAGIDESLLSVQLECEPENICLVPGLAQESAKTVTVRLEYRGVTSKSVQILDETGSALPLLFATFALVFAILAAGVNIQAASLYQQRASNLARFLVHKSAKDSSLTFEKLDVTAYANLISKRLMFSSQPVDRAWVSSPDNKTAIAQVCLGFRAPLDFFVLPVSRACAKASMRRVVG